MTRFTTIILCLIGVFNSVNAQEVYRNDKAKLSFALPEGWEQTPYDRLSDHYRLSWDHVRDEMTGMELFSMKSTSSLETPYIYFEAVIDTTQSEVEKEARYLPYIGREQEYIEDHWKFWQRDINWLRTDRGGDSPKSWKGAELIKTDLYYDQERHAAFKTIELYKESVGKILYVDINILGSRRFAAFDCYWDGENPDEFLDLLDGIVDSFS